VVAGNVKLDSLPHPLTAERRAEMRAAWGIVRRDGEEDREPRVLMFGSTHEGEEALALEVFEELRSEFGDLRLILCPRHPERFAAVWEAMGETVRRRAAGGGEAIVARRASDLAAGHGDDAPGAATDLLLVDQMGVLAESYGVADIAVMGGTYVPVGGHNLLEATAHGVPIFCGPHLHAQVEIARLLEEADLLLQVDSSELGVAIAELLGDSEGYETLRRRSLDLIDARRGVGERVFDELRARGLLPKAAPAETSPES
jgi:3-deoxy-D-manno-octulosonic-acid transferase